MKLKTTLKRKAVKGSSLLIAGMTMMSMSSALYAQSDVSEAALTTTTKESKVKLNRWSKPVISNNDGEGCIWIQGSYKPIQNPTCKPDGSIQNKPNKPNKPEVETPEVETPEVETPEVETPEVETPEVETPEVETPEVETPGVDTPEVNEPDSDITEDVSSQTAYENKVLELVNVERAKQGLDALQMDESLRAVARLKSEDMRKNNYFDHTSPTYGTPFEMMKQYGISYKTAGENIAQGYKSPEAVVEGWMNSSGHRANILNSTFTHMGVGFDSNGNYWTQMFIGK